LIRGKLNTGDSDQAGDDQQTEKTCLRKHVPIIDHKKKQPRATMVRGYRLRDLA
jgi:hypothetical protein